GCQSSGGRERQRQQRLGRSLHRFPPQGRSDWAVLPASARRRRHRQREMGPVVPDKTFGECPSRPSPCVIASRGSPMTAPSRLPVSLYTPPVFVPAALPLEHLGVILPPLWAGWGSLGDSRAFVDTRDCSMLLVSEDDYSTVTARSGRAGARHS